LDVDKIEDKGTNQENAKEEESYVRKSYKDNNVLSNYHEDIAFIPEITGVHQDNTSEITGVDNNDTEKSKTEMNENGNTTDTPENTAESNRTMADTTNSNPLGNPTMTMKFP